MSTGEGSEGFIKVDPDSLDPLVVPFARLVDYEYFGRVLFCFGEEQSQMHIHLVGPLLYTSESLPYRGGLLFFVPDYAYAAPNGARVITFYPTNPVLCMSFTIIFPNDKEKMRFLDVILQMRHKMDLFTEKYPPIPVVCQMIGTTKQISLHVTYDKVNIIGLTEKTKTTRDVIASTVVEDESIDREMVSICLSLWIDDTPPVFIVIPSYDALFTLVCQLYFLRRTTDRANFEKIDRVMRPFREEIEDFKLGVRIHFDSGFDTSITPLMKVPINPLKSGSLIPPKSSWNLTMMPEDKLPERILLFSETRYCQPINPDTAQPFRKQRRKYVTKESICENLEKNLEDIHLFFNLPASGEFCIADEMDREYYNMDSSKLSNGLIYKHITQQDHQDLFDKFRIDPINGQTDPGAPLIQALEDLLSDECTKEHLSEIVELLILCFTDGINSHSFTGVISDKEESLYAIMFEVVIQHKLYRFTQDLLSNFVLLQKMYPSYAAMRSIAFTSAFLSITEQIDSIAFKPRMGPRTRMKLNIQMIDYTISEAADRACAFYKAKEKCKRGRHPILNLVSRLTGLINRGLILTYNRGIQRSFWPAIALSEAKIKDIAEESTVNVFIKIARESKCSSDDHRMGLFLLKGIIVGMGNLCFLHAISLATPGITHTKNAPIFVREQLNLVIDALTRLSTVFVDYNQDEFIAYGPLFVSVR